MEIRADDSVCQTGFSSTITPTLNRVNGARAALSRHNDNVLLLTQ
jgi:hypothetical protein